MPQTAAGSTGTKSEADQLLPGTAASEHRNFCSRSQVAQYPALSRKTCSPEWLQTTSAFTEMNENQLGKSHGGRNQQTYCEIVY